MIKAIERIIYFIREIFTDDNVDFRNYEFNIGTYMYSVFLFVLMLSWIFLAHRVITLANVIIAQKHIIHDCGNNTSHSNAIR